MTIVLSIGLIVAVAAVISLPFMRSARVADGPQDVERERLEREKTAALVAIREAELDHAMGKLSDEDHTHLRSFYEQRAVAAMGALGKSPKPAKRQ